VVWSHPIKNLGCVAYQALSAQAAQQAGYQADLGRAWPNTGLIFTTRIGRRVEPRNFVRSFRRICYDNDIRLIKVHHLRHTVASLLKDLHVPARDAQAILGHTRISTTLEIYTDTADEGRATRSPGSMACSISMGVSTDLLLQKAATFRA
jgi:integrase